MRHALEPDHLAAVSTLAAEQRGRRAGLLLGAFWGLGHALSLIFVAGTLIVVEAQMPERVGLWLEAMVGAAIVVLGLRAIAQAVKLGRVGPVHTHTHGGEIHAHAGPPAHVHVSKFTLATRPLIMGVLHGVAGSGALTALVLARMEGIAARLTYVAVFGLGSIAGMAMLTAAATASLARLRARRKLNVALLGGAGSVAVVTGLFWGASSVSQLLA